MPHTDPHITAQIETFTQQIVATVEAAVAQRIQAALAVPLGFRKNADQVGHPSMLWHCGGCDGEKIGGKEKRPKHLCPVPGCKNVAAPVFGMVCKDHKNVAKSEIKKYGRSDGREGHSRDRGQPAAAKKVKKVTPKVRRARKLQGRSLAALKSLTGADRAKVKKTAAEKACCRGREAGAVDMKREKSESHQRMSQGHFDLDIPAAATVGRRPEESIRGRSPAIMLTFRTVGDTVRMEICEH